MKPPSGLSERSKGIWTRLCRTWDFEAADLEILQRSLENMDLGDTLLEQAVSAGFTSPAGKAALGARRDVQALALKYWAALKLHGGGDGVRRPGRPSDDGWSAKRRRDPVSGRLGPLDVA